MRITDKQVKKLNAARDILAALEKDARKESWQGNGREGHELGRLSESASVAGDALFNVLNVARSYCEVPLTDEQIHNRKDEEVPA